MRNKSMNAADRIKMILARPVEYFKKLRDEKGIMQAFWYYALFYFIFAALTLVVSYFTEAASVTLFKSFGVPVPENPGFATRLFTMIFSYLFALIFSFIVAGILYIYLRIFGGKADYTQTYNLFIYSGTPTLLFGWIPLMSFFAGIWSLVLLILGTSEVHKMTRLRATLLYLIPLAFFFIIIAIVLAFAAFIFATQFT